MKVLVLGSGVIGVTTALLPRAGGPRRHRRRPAARSRRSRRASPTRARFRRAIRRRGRRRVCRSRRSNGSSCGTGRSSSGRCSTRRCGSGACASLRNCTDGALRREQEPDAAPRANTAARASKRCAPTPASATTSGCRARCSSSARRRRSTARRADMAILERFGVPHELLDRAGCVRAEPALARVQQKIAGGLRLPGDETGDCFKFTQNLARIAAQAGVDVPPGTRHPRRARRGRADHRRRTPTRAR